MKSKIPPCISKKIKKKIIRLLLVELARNEINGGKNKIQYARIEHILLINYINVSFEKIFVEIFIFYI